MPATPLSSYAFRTFTWFGHHRTATVFVAVLVVLGALDVGLYVLGSWLWPPLEDPAVLPEIGEAAAALMDFAPEVWVGLLALVLGTLIIVISVASQRTPKLIDLYMHDWVSLFYVWFITIAFLHNVLMQYQAETWITARETSVLLNTCLFLPVAALLAVPYIFYILSLTKPSNVIRKIHYDNLRHIRWLTHPVVRDAMRDPRVVARQQHRLFGTLNQLDDLLEFVAFKEPKGQIIRALGSALQTYVHHKSQLPPHFFRLSEPARDDISFKTLVSQFDDIERDRTFYELKGFRLLGSAYLKLIERHEFELSSLCIFQINGVARAALASPDDRVIDAVIIRLNTILRFGIKQGTRETELRNLYNALFHYGQFVQQLVDGRRIEHVQRCCLYLKIYGTEIYRISRTQTAFSFLVDVVAAEMRKILIRIAEAGWVTGRQGRLLDLLLQLDTLPDVDKNEVQASSIIYDRVRMIQVSLALFYLRREQHTLANRIVNDILEDARYIGEPQLRRAVETTCSELSEATPTFWEDTDRGNANLYYSPDTAYLPAFRKLFEERLSQAALRPEPSAVQAS